MKLYVCWGTFGTPGHAHACQTAHQALLKAGYEPEVIKTNGLGVGPRIFHWTTDGRREVERLSGQKVVPVLLTDGGEVLNESARIIEWAQAHPKTTAASA
jgi:glutathione S-transferase